MNFKIARRKLIENCLIPAGISDKRLLKVMGEIPRHRFVDGPFAYQAYSDNSLPIGFNQTISKPSVVARMLQAANLRIQDEVLEVGTGSGYQTAILSRLVRRVHSVDIIEPFIRKAKPILSQLDCWNVCLKKSDGHWGLPEKAPFDVIITCACAEKLPEILLEQLKEGGRLVAPVQMGREQRIHLWIKNGDHNSKIDLGPCVFVPLVKSRATHGRLGETVKGNVC